MPKAGKHLDELSKLKIVRLILLEWKPEAIAEEIGCSHQTVRRIERNWTLYQNPNKTPVNNGRPRKIPPEAVDDLFQWIDGFVATEEKLFLHQSDMQKYLNERYGINVTRSTISRLLDERKKRNEGTAGGGEMPQTVNVGQDFEAAEASSDSNSTPNDLANSNIDPTLSNPPPAAPIYNTASTSTSMSTQIPTTYHDTTTSSYPPHNQTQPYPSPSNQPQHHPTPSSYTSNDSTHNPINRPFHPTSNQPSNATPTPLQKTTTTNPQITTTQTPTSTSHLRKPRGRTKPTKPDIPYVLPSATPPDSMSANNMPGNGIGSNGAGGIGPGGVGGYRGPGYGSPGGTIGGVGDTGNVGNGAAGAGAAAAAAAGTPGAHQKRKRPIPASLPKFSPWLSEQHLNPRF